MPTDSKTERTHVLALHRYFTWADRMRRHFENCSPPPAGTTWPFEHVLYMGYWYAGLYVVIEGWKELKLLNDEIDRLLESPNVKLLQRYRNGVYHFQKDYDDARFFELINDGVEPVAWVRNLHTAFGSYLLQAIRAKPQKK